MDRAEWEGAGVRGVTDIRVYVFHTDMVGVVYNSRYLDWFEIGRSELMRDRGLPYAEVERRGYSLPVTETHFRIRSSARYDELIRIETRIGKLGSRSVAFLYEIRSGTTLRAEGTTVHVAVSHQDGKACSFPDWLVGPLRGEPGPMVEKSTQ
jgi:acyl-CoA thioester hydrolase